MSFLDNPNKYSLKIIDYSFMHVLEILYINIISNSLMKSKTKSTAFTMVTIIIMLILILPTNITLNGFSQTIKSPGFQLFNRKYSKRNGSARRNSYESFIRTT